MNYDEWWEGLVAEHDEWKYADSEALRRAAFQAGAASRDAEIQRLQIALADAEALELGTAEKCDQLRAELDKCASWCEERKADLASALRAIEYKNRYIEKQKTELVEKMAESNRRLDLMNTLDAELEAARTEIERLNGQYALSVEVANTSVARSLECADQLTASQAENVHLRGLLQFASSIIGHPDDNGTTLIREALAPPSDTSALEAMIAKAGDVMRAKCQSVCTGPNGDWNIFADEVEQAISALPAVKIDDFK